MRKTKNREIGPMNWEGPDRIIKSYREIKETEYKAEKETKHLTFSMVSGSWLTACRKRRLSL